MFFHKYSPFFFLFDTLFFPLYCCSGWGYIMAFIFTEVLTMYQMYHIWIQPLTALLHPFFPNIIPSFYKSHFIFFYHIDKHGIIRVGFFKWNLWGFLTTYLYLDIQMKLIFLLFFSFIVVLGGDTLCQLQRTL
jgi:hypothetical protein